MEEIDRIAHINSTVMLSVVEDDGKDEEEKDAEVLRQEEESKNQKYKPIETSKNILVL